jgi:ubiquinone/menaquinone biosynthesis C-methylase UbiE
MTEGNLAGFARYYDQIYLNMKDYEKEAEIVKNVIRRLEKKQSNTLLDVGCGTGEHVRYLSLDFGCMGIDINKDMIRIAKRKVSNARFKVADMTNFELEEKFDVITCLFSSIGYVQNFTNLVKTFGNFLKHLSKNGLVLVEPWVFKKDFRKNHIGLDIYENEKLKLARMSTSRIIKSKWLIFMHYLVGENGKIRYFQETHEMLALDYEDYLKAFQMAGFSNVDFLKDNLWNGCRGLFVAYKPHSLSETV